jgi:hypothetical protein
MTKQPPKTRKSPPPKAAKPPVEALFRPGEGSRAKKTGVAFEPKPEHRQLVVLLRGVGYAEDQIAKLINWPEGIDPKTLRKHFRDELDHGDAFAHAQVAKTLFAVATDKTHKNCVTAQIFFLKARAGWRDSDPRTASVKVETPGVDGEAPVTFTLKIGERDADADD